MYTQYYYIRIVHNVKPRSRHREPKTNKTMQIKSSTWFEAKVTYSKASDTGSTKKANEQYVVNAMSFTEAESRVTKYTADYDLQDAVIATLKRADYEEIIFSTDENDDRWFKVKLAYVETNEKTDAEKRTYVSYLVQAANIDKANQYIKDMMKDSVSNWVIESSSETKFMDVIEK